MRVTNEMLKDYMSMGDKIAKLNKKRGEIRKAILAQGSCSTADYVATVEALKKERVAGREELEKVFGRETLLENFLIKTYISQEINVIEKAEALCNATA
jgi:hypothetical protein